MGCPIRIVCGYVRIDRGRQRYRSAHPLTARIKRACDRDLLIEAAANLVDNAVKFTPEIDRILRETITDPVGPEFMAPPSLSIAA